MEQYIGVDDLCQRLNFKKRYIYALTHEGRIPHIKVGRHLRFRWSSIEKWLNAQEMKNIEIKESLSWQR